MKDLKKMDIEGIERHWYNFRMFTKFLKQRGLYQTFKKIIFTDSNRTPYDLFVTINKENIRNIITYLGRPYCEIDQKWGSVFSYNPFGRFHWIGKVGEITNYDNMCKLSNEWHTFLRENNYDKQLK